MPRWLVVHARRWRHGQVNGADYIFYLVSTMSNPSPAKMRQMRRASDVPGALRVRSVGLIASAIHSSDTNAMAREIESHAHSAAVDASHYEDLVLKAAINCRNAPHNVCVHMATMPDAVLMRGTVTQRVRDTEEERSNLFAKMLQEKYDSIKSRGDASASLRCRRCNSTEILVEQKQTRSADEGMSVYCLCGTCNNRWTMR